MKYLYVPQFNFVVLRVKIELFLNVNFLILFNFVLK